MADIKQSNGPTLEVSHQTRLPKKAVKAMDRVLFPNTTAFLLLLLPFVLVGFWPGYWVKLPGPIDTIIHVHTALMMGWVLLGIVQPFLILKKKVKWHIVLGKVSYVLMPLLLASGYFLVKFRYYRMLDRINGDVASGKVQFTTEQVFTTAAHTVRLGLVYFLLLAFLYGLAVVNRKRFLQHATYMFAAILTVLGPAVDRIIAQVYNYYGMKMEFWGAHATLLFTLVLLGVLAFYHKQKGQSPLPALISFGSYAIAFLILEFCTKTKAWQTMVEMIF